MSDAEVTGRLVVPDTTSGTASSITGIVAETPGSSATNSLTTSLSTFTRVLPDGQTAVFTQTVTVVISPTTPTSERSTTATVTATATPTPTASATNSSTANESSNNSNIILIVAIAVPVAVVALLSLGLFWWWMRRRARKAVSEDTSFPMVEKPPSLRRHSRDESMHSHSSTRYLVSGTSPDTPTKKEAILEIKDVTRSSSDLSRTGPLTQPTGLGIGVAESPEGTPLHSRQNSHAQSTLAGPPAKATKAVRNFSRGPSRPGTATSEHRPSENQFAARDRSMSASNRPDLRDPRARPSPIPEVMSPPPNMRSPHPMGTRDPMRNGSSPYSSPSLPGPPPHGQPPRPKGRQGPPPAIETQPQGLYKPSVNRALGQDSTRQEPYANSRGAAMPQKTDSSPASPLGNSFSEENMRIARLANSSSMGWYKDANPHLSSIATSPQVDQTVEPPTPSPRLPPPATRDAPPSNFPPPPPEPESKVSAAFLNDRRSVVSRISSTDGYEDAEIDAKSDVSSLDEREKWEMEHDQIPRANTQTSKTTRYAGLSQGVSSHTPLVQNGRPSIEQAQGSYGLPRNY